MFRLLIMFVFENWKEKFCIINCQRTLFEDKCVRHAEGATERSSAQHRANSEPGERRPAGARPNNKIIGTLH